MKKILILSLLYFLAVSVSAQQISTDPLNAKPLTTEIAVVSVPENVLVLAETEYDFGKIPQGKPVTHIFEVMNKSNVPLVISNVAASCGCTTPEWEKGKTVAPGSGTKITVGYNSAAEGPFDKFITISYNDTQTKQIIIKGEVWKTPGNSAPENKGLNDLKN